VLAWLAGQTEKINLGSAIFQMPARSPGDGGHDRRDTRPDLGRAFPLGIGPPVRRYPRVGTASASRASSSAPRVRRGRTHGAGRERLEYRGETIELPLPDGPGKALKLTIGPVQERIPVYIAAIGPKNVTLVGEIADGWLPVFFSPEHVSEFRPLLEEGAAKAGRSLDDGFDISPTVNVLISDDRDAARDVMRPVLALYVGGMGSREKNFYNQLVQRYGFEDAAREVQDLYLEGKKDEAAAALPAELIDAVALAGPRDAVRDRLAVYRDAGVGTLQVSRWRSTSTAGATSCGRSRSWPRPSVALRRVGPGAGCGRVGLEQAQQRRHTSGSSCDPAESRSSAMASA